MNQLERVLTDALRCDAESLPPGSTPLAEIEDWDSLMHVTLVVGLEASFGVKLSAEEIQAMVTIADVGRILKEKGIDG